MTKDAFDQWHEWAEKPVDSMLTISSEIHEAVMALPPEERRDREKVNEAVRDKQERQVSEMIERMARAAYHSVPRNRPWEKLSAWNKKMALEGMRAAIEVMREPTDEMVSAGASNLGDLDVDFAPASETVRGALECWKDMIDAALHPINNQIPA